MIILAIAVVVLLPFVLIYGFLRTGGLPFQH